VLETVPAEILDIAAYYQQNKKPYLWLCNYYNIKPHSDKTLVSYCGRLLMIIKYQHGISMERLAIEYGKFLSKYGFEYVFQHMLINKKWSAYIKVDRGIVY